MVTFSFQHAPLGQSSWHRNSQNLRPWADVQHSVDILETNGIAWPNPQMWRRPQNNPAVPVPTYCPEEGAESHLHSPRRKTYAGRSTATSSVARPGPVPSTYRVGTGFGTMPPGFLMPPKNPVASSPGYVDPFSEAAYQEWVNSLGFQQHQNSIEPTAIWPTTSTQNGTKHPVSEIVMSMTDYVPSVIGQDVNAGSLSTSAPSLDEDSPMGNFNVKVPANTPTTMSSASTSPSGLGCSTDSISHVY